jgi:opacity protein-like surface antigen
MFKIIIIGVFLSILILLPVTSRSQTTQTSVYFGPHLGIQKAPDAEKSNYLVGATLRLRLMPVIGVEGDIGYRQEKYGSDAVTVKSWPVTVTGLIYPLPIIYGGVGAGWYNTTFDYANIYNQAGFDDETTTEFGWHLVAGVELPASPNLKLFGDIRYVFLDYKFKDLPNAVLDGVKSDFYSINVGLLFRL